MNKIISDISDYIFVADTPQKVDAIFLPGGTYPELPEYAAELFHKGYADFIVPSGGISIMHDKWKGVSSKADIYTANYNSDCEFFTDVLIKNNVSQDVIICENQSQHTRDNAFLSRKIVDEIGLQQKKVLTKF